MGPDLVYHIITSIDGERDPRNLNYLFSMLPAILRIVSLGHLTEDFYEVMACYFPVDFQPVSFDIHSWHMFCSYELSTIIFFLMYRQLQIQIKSQGRTWHLDYQNA